jgi:hypothetical protein
VGVLITVRSHPTAPTAAQEWTVNDMTLNKETISFITKLLNEQVNITRNSLMSSIDHGHNALIDNGIKMYREALYARNDFFEWVDDQEDGE